jgi:hypothetical protein
MVGMVCLLLPDSAVRAITGDPGAVVKRQPVWAMETSVGPEWTGSFAENIRFGRGVRARRMGKLRGQQTFGCGAKTKKALRGPPGIEIYRNKWSF